MENSNQVFKHDALYVLDAIGVTREQTNKAEEVLIDALNSAKKNSEGIQNVLNSPLTRLELCYLLVGFVTGNVEAVTESRSKES